jgi:hypothetical protein
VILARLGPKAEQVVLGRRWWGDFGGSADADPIGYFPKLRTTRALNHDHPKSSWDEPTSCMDHPHRPASRRNHRRAGVRLSSRAVPTVGTSQSRCRASGRTQARVYRIPHTASSAGWFTPIRASICARPGGVQASFASEVDIDRACRSGKHDQSFPTTGTGGGGDVGPSASAGLDTDEGVLCGRCGSIRPGQAKAPNVGRGWRSARAAVTVDPRRGQIESGRHCYSYDRSKRPGFRCAHDASTGRRTLQLPMERCSWNRLWSLGQRFGRASPMAGRRRSRRRCAGEVSGRCSRIFGRLKKQMSSS